MGSTVNYDQVIKLHLELNRMLKYQNSIATISSELKNFQTEYEYFKDYLTMGRIYTIT